MKKLIKCNNNNNDNNNNLVSSSLKYPDNYVQLFILNSFSTIKDGVFLMRNYFSLTIIV